MSEHEAQVQVVVWARSNEWLYPELAWLLAVPNGGLRNKVTALKLRAEGVRAGVSDLFLPHPSRGFHGLWVEMKVGTNKLKPEQERFLEDMNRAGYLAVACWGADQAIRTIRCYLRSDG